MSLFYPLLNIKINRESLFKIKKTILKRIYKYYRILHNKYGGKKKKRIEKLRKHIGKLKKKQLKENKC